MVFENLHRLFAGQQFHIRLGHLPVLIDIQPQTAHSFKGHPVFCRPAQIIWVIDIAAFSGAKYRGRFCRLFGVCAVLAWLFPLFQRGRYCGQTSNKMSMGRSVVLFVGVFYLLGG